MVAITVVLVIVGSLCLPNRSCVCWSTSTEIVTVGGLSGRLGEKELPVHSICDGTVGDRSASFGVRSARSRLEPAKNPVLQMKMTNQLLRRD